MVWLVALAFLVVPVAELAAIVAVSGRVGIGPTLLLLIVISIAGAWLVRREGTTVLHRVQDQLRSGTVPRNDLVDGALILFAGALLLTPGFLTDGLGLFLLIPPTRALVRSLVVARMRTRVQRGVTSVRGGFQVWSTGPDLSGPGFGRRGRIYDATSTEATTDPPEEGEARPPQLEP